MANVKSETVKTGKAKVAKVSSKASGNTPIKSVTKSESKAGVFAIAAGIVVKIENKSIVSFVKRYHAKAGNLEITPAGIKLTAKGAANFTARIAAAPADFQTIAMYTRKAGAVPANTRWQTGGQPVTIAEGVRMPPLIHWQGWTTQEMRLAFASIWSKA